jgi:hypothetical protein
MRIIDVLIKLANDEIKDGTELKVHDSIGRILKYTFCEKLKVFRDKRFDGMDRVFSINNSFLNLEVELIPPKPKKYQLRLYEDDDLSYVTRSSYDNDFNYDLGDENEIMEFKTKFTQEEIDNDKFLKFIEQHGIKEEVEDDAVN